jgi:2-polyprenyl-3-methyl-5-hydroxy-6-metoxy-1,4-benzoquinol methylase
MSNQVVFDESKANTFAESLLVTLNHSAISIMISIGHRTGLFDIMKGMEPATSQEIAQKANLDERYIREWLGAMSTAGITTVSDDSKYYHLPNEHAAFLTREAGANNFALFFQYIGLMGSVEDKILHCFRNGGGVPYSDFPRFHEVMAEDSGQSVLSSLESHILPLVPGLTDKLAKGISVLDAGCGSGRIIIKLAQLYPNSHFTGLDLSEEAITRAQKESKEKNLSNVTFAVKDLTDFDKTSPGGQYDLITTFDAVHDQAKPLNLLKGINHALKDDGVYLMQDIKGSSHVHNNLDHPIGPFLYTVSCMHCMTVSLAQGGDGLGAMWGEELTTEYLRNAGFTSVTTNKLEHDIQNNWYVVRKK